MTKTNIYWDKSLARDANCGITAGPSASLYRQWRCVPNTLYVIKVKNTSLPLHCNYDEVVFHSWNVEILWIQSIKICLCSLVRYHIRTIKNNLCNYVTLVRYLMYIEDQSLLEYCKDESLWWLRQYAPLKRRSKTWLHDVISQKAPIFTVVAMKPWSILYIIYNTVWITSNKYQQNICHTGWFKVLVQY
jgi:hypothetical protein